MGRDAPLERLVRLVYRCDWCGGQAGAVELTIGGEQSGRLMVNGLVYRESASLTGKPFWELRNAVTLGSAAELYRANPLWASFFCPDCGVCYCRNHWTLDPRFDDDFPGWYDATYGTCPRGHRRLVDD